MMHTSSEVQTGPAFCSPSFQGRGWACARKPGCEAGASPCDLPVPYTEAELRSIGAWFICSLRPNPFYCEGECAWACVVVAFRQRALWPRLVSLTGEHCDGASHSKFNTSELQPACREIASVVT